MEIIDIVNKLVGKISPVGDSAADKERFENLQTMCDLIEELVIQLDSIAQISINIKKY